MSTLTELSPPEAPTVVRVRRRTLPMVVHQIHYEQLGFWRNPPAMIFTFVFPVAVIAIFGLVFSGDDSFAVRKATLVVAGEGDRAR